MNITDCELIWDSPTWQYWYFKLNGVKYTYVASETTTEQYTAIADGGIGNVPIFTIDAYYPLDKTNPIAGIQKMYKIMILQ